MPPAVPASAREHLVVQLHLLGEPGAVVRGLRHLLRRLLRDYHVRCTRLDVINDKGTTL